MSSLQQHPATTAHAVAEAFGFAPGALVFNQPHDGVLVLRGQLDELQMKAAAIRRVASRDAMTKEMQLQLDRINGEAVFVQQRINRLMDATIEEANVVAVAREVPRAPSRQPAPIRHAAPAIHASASAPAPPAKRAPSETDPRRWGFGNFNEFVAAVKRSSAKGGHVDPRLVGNAAAPSTYGSESKGSDGGFAVPPDFRDTIMSKVLGEQSLLTLTDQQISSNNSITFPADETTPWQTTGGIQAFWEGEGEPKPQSKPELTEKLVKLNKIIALVPLSDELLEDSAAMASYVNRKAPEKINARINEAIVRGSGQGMPLGILRSPATVVVPKETGQAADSVVFNNITKLWTAITPAARRKARWLMNPDVEQHLMTMQFPGTGTAVPAYVPPGGLSAAPYGTLLGRPIIYSEAMAPVGELGDIVFGDLANYLIAVKTGGIRSEVSMHLWFDYDLTAFRFLLRVGGQPWWNAPIVPASIASTKRGFFATLAERG